MKLTLTYAPTACSIVPYVALTEAGAEFDTHIINLSKNEHHHPSNLEINPKGKVPTLIIDGDPLTENTAIQIWIAQQYPHANLLPKDPLEFVKAVSIMSWCAAGIHPKLTQQARPERYCDVPGSAPHVQALGSHSFFEMLEIADQMLAHREWFFDHFTSADTYFFWCFRRGSQFKPDLSQFSHCLAHQRRMEQRPSVQKVLAFEKSILEQFSKA